MTSSAVGFLIAIVVIIAIYFLFVVPGERKYHDTKLRLMQERIERHNQRRKTSANDHSRLGDTSIEE